MPPSRIKCSPSATHNPVTVDVGGGKKRCGKLELNRPQNAWSIVFQSWENHCCLGQTAWLPVQPQMTLNKALITLIREIAFCRASLHLGALSQLWSQHPLHGLTHSQTSHPPTAYNTAPNCTSVCPWLISSPSPPLIVDNRHHPLLFYPLTWPSMGNSVHTVTIEHSLRTGGWSATWFLMELPSYWYVKWYCHCCSSIRCSNNHQSNT